MRIDYGYLKEFLDVFLDSEKATVTWNDFKHLRENEENFIFHFEILIDKQFIATSLSNHSYGVRGLSDNYLVDLKPWRLTSDGHDFSCALNDPGLILKINNRIKKEGISAVIDISKKVLTKRAEKIFDEIDL
ncbi:DUF2513 domain-containing protein [Photobacterium indicum]|uniref:DUF2513 domain-containing protein n=1 Tax=Photobacterium indicum TaxID=81447 RepID=A0A2T3LEK0_9GAMM|nr:DUF2513 domain-containing protein [Photobacterium indicum]PSV49804.1 hypothetical protein C9J47_04400 [Photobacterium indicum]